jgi:hypothetical protein
MDYNVPLKALVLRDDKNALKDLGDVLAVARSQAKRVLRTHSEVRVVDLIRASYGWIAVFEAPKKVEADARGRTGGTDPK